MSTDRRNTREHYREEYRNMRLGYPPHVMSDVSVCAYNSFIERESAKTREKWGIKPVYRKLQICINS